jgi:GNAT superfamily N-acetyltransferase
MMLKLEEGMTPEERDVLSSKLGHFNKTQSPPIGDSWRKDIHLVLRDEVDALVGGLIGVIYRGCLAIEILYIDESHRGKNQGERLMNAAEEIARKEGCHFIHLDTFSFQAPGFYTKMGYQIFGTLEGYTEYIKRYYLKKELK